MSCNKINNKCLSKQYASCVEYQKPLPEITKIKKDCYSIEDTTEDLYNILEGVHNNNYFSNNELECIYNTDREQIPSKDVIIKLEQEICQLREKVKNLEKGKHLCNQLITGCNLNFGALQTACGDSITTLGELLQVIIDKIQPDPRGTIDREDQM